MLHATRNVGPGRGRLMVLAAPGDRHRRFFETLGEPLGPGEEPRPLSGPPDFARIAAVGRENGIHFVPPAEAGG